MRKGRQCVLRKVRGRGGHSAGRFLRIQPGELKSLSRDPIEQSAYMEDYVAEFASVYSGNDCASTISNLGSLDAGLAADIGRMDRRLSGLGYSETERLGEVDVDAIRIVADTPRKTPFLPTIKPPLL